MASFATRNLGLDDGGIAAIYLIGGGFALVTTRCTGWVIDRIGPLVASVGVCLVLSAILPPAFLMPAPTVLAIALLGLALAAQLARSTVAQASAVRVAAPADRMAYQYLVAACTSLFQAAGAAVSTLVLSTRPDGTLSGIGWIVLLSLVATWVALALVRILDRRLTCRETQQSDRYSRTLQ